MKIDLKFDKDMASAVLAGRKCCTFRRTKHGSVGDTFEVDGCTYRILQVGFVLLFEAMYKYYGAEGFESQEDMEMWAIQHYGKEYASNLEGFVHFFARVPEAGQ